MRCVTVVYQSRNSGREFELPIEIAYARPKIPHGVFISRVDCWRSSWSRPRWGTWFQKIFLNQEQAELCVENRAWLLPKGWEFDESFASPSGR